jgi:hypothetical protein
MSANERYHARHGLAKQTQGPYPRRVTAEAPKPPPGAIRITRPYSTEEEFLEHELDMLTRTTVTLVGAQSRPAGVVLRFELGLTSGQVLMRGEGRVLVYKTDALQGTGGLTLRFTRLDTRSKSLVDRATAMREHRRPSAAPPLPRGASVPDVSDLPGLTPVAALPAVAPSAPALPTFSRAPEPPPPPQPPPLLALAPELDPEPELPAPAAVVVAEAPVRAVPPVRLSVAAPDRPERDALLGRLRARAKTLDASDVQRILAQRKRPATA